MSTLEEKREIKKAQDTWLPERNKELAELSGGGAMSFDINWDSFAGDTQGLNWLDFNGPQQVVNAFRIVGVDELGREALRATVKQVVVRNTPEEADKKMELVGGVFTLTCAIAKSPGGRFTHDQIRDFLVSKM